MVSPVRIDGIDISHYQNNRIDYELLKKSGVEWLYHKCTEGAGYVDPNYNKRRAECLGAGLSFGGYHFARPEGSDAKAEAEFFIRTAAPLPGDLRPALDLEVKGNLSDPEIVKWADTFCDRVEELTGVVPVVYTPFTLSTRLESRAIFWVPRYNNSNTPPTRAWDIWQFSNGQYGYPNYAAGVGNVDLNTSKVSTTTLRIPQPKETRGKHIDAALDDLSKAKGGGRRGILLKRAARVLKKIPILNKSSK